MRQQTNKFSAVKDPDVTVSAQLIGLFVKNHADNVVCIAVCGRHPLKNHSDIDILGD